MTAFACTVIAAITSSCFNIYIVMDKLHTQISLISETLIMADWSRGHESLKAVTP